MPTHDPRIDAYIEKSAEFARPILAHLRELVHAGCPEVIETMKWSSPSFEHHGLLCGMGAFKEHCTFGFWRGSLVAVTDREKEAMGQFGRITQLSDLPTDEEIVAYVRKAAEINVLGIKEPRPLKHPKPPLVVPDDLTLELAKEENQTARETFDDFPPSHKREYLEWLEEAKAEETRARRLATTIEWLNEGKSRNWKYMEKKAAPSVSPAVEEAPPEPAAVAASSPSPITKAKPSSEGKTKASRAKAAAKGRSKAKPKAKKKAKQTSKARTKTRAKASVKGKAKTKASSKGKAKAKTKTSRKAATKRRAPSARRKPARRAKSRSARSKRR